MKWLIVTLSLLVSLTAHADRGLIGGALAVLFGDGHPRYQQIQPVMVYPEAWGNRYASPPPLVQAPIVYEQPQVVYQQAPVAVAVPNAPVYNTTITNNYNAPHQVQQVPQQMPLTKPKKVDETPRTAYVKECMRYGYTKQKCIDIWDNRVPEVYAPKQDAEDDEEVSAAPAPMIFTHKNIPAQPVQKASEPVTIVARPVELIDVDNEDYKAKRAEVLKRPDAVVHRFTLR